MEGADDEPFQLIEHSIIEQYEPDKQAPELEMSELQNSDSLSESVNSLSEDLDEKTMYGYLGDMDQELISAGTKKYARMILLESKYEVPTVKFVPPDFETPRDYILTNDIILSHVEVIKEIFRISPTDRGPRHIVTYVCKSFEHAGVSPVAGSTWRNLGYADQVAAVLTVARIVADHMWSDLDDSVYAEFHGHLDRQAFFYVQELRTNRLDRGGCCNIM